MLTDKNFIILELNPKLYLMLKKSWPFLLLAVLSFTVHFAFLSYPAQVVFDEVHFGKFVAGYFTHQYFFDIHPPLGKMLIAGFAKIANVNPIFAFEKIGENIPGSTLFWLRFLPAFFGSLFVLFFSWLAYLTSRSKKIALIAGFLILMDNAFLVQSKFILVDIFLVSFEILTFCFFFLWQRQKSFSAKWFSYLALTALFFGLTISIKWTGLATIGILGVILFVKIFSKNLSLYLSAPAPSHPEHIRLAQYKLREGSIIDSSRLTFDPLRHSFSEASESKRAASATTLGLRMTKWRSFKESLIGLTVIFLIGFIVYLASFYLHFKLLFNSGPGDAFMSRDFQTELKYGRENTDQPLSFGEKFIELNKTMYTANASVTSEHPFGSRWYNWPIGQKLVYYWNQNQTEVLPLGWKAKIFISGNLFLWWLALFCLAFVALASFFKKGRQQCSPILYILILGYLTNLLPFVLVNRVAFLYHYLPSVVFAILLTSFFLGHLLPKYKKIFVIIILVIFLSFIVIAPFSYGWPMPAKLDELESKLILF